VDTAFSFPKGSAFPSRNGKNNTIGETTIDLTEVKPIENIVSAPDVQQAQQAQLQSYKKFAPLLAIFALILISVGFIRALSSWQSATRRHHWPRYLVELGDTWNRVFIRRVCRAYSGRHVAKNHGSKNLASLWP
jgi:hypothetical protein